MCYLNNIQFMFIAILINYQTALTYNISKALPNNLNIINLLIIIKNTYVTEVLLLTTFTRYAPVTCLNF